MPSSHLRISLAALALGALALPAWPAARLTYQINGSPTPVIWQQSSFPIKYAVDRRLAAASPEMAANVDRAFQEWAAVPDADVSFDSVGVRDVKFGQDGVNSVTLFDELYQGQKFIALTTPWYDTTNGNMLEADIQLDPTALTGNYNVGLLIEHEVGHLLGLDHSAVLSSVMYPYVGKGGLSALDSDEKIAIATLYPRMPVGGATLQGEVRGNDGGIFAAQVVAVNDDGEPVATGLTNARGEFELRGVPAGNYRIYAEPLDGPVDSRNLSGVWRQAKMDSFPTQFMSKDPVRIDNGKVYGNLIVNSSGNMVQLNPRWIGACAAGSSNISLTATTAVLQRGKSVRLAVGGDGFTSGMTTFEVMNPGIRRVSNFEYASNYVYADFNVAPTVSPGSAVILVHSGNDSATLTGALRVEGPKRMRIASR